jgi:precorrin-6A/cobalt-precorrin-6A reductase
MMTTRILILGGTTEARELAQALAGRAGLDVLLSLAGRTREPATQPAPVRIGGFGGAEGLAEHLRASRTDLLVDATHPFAAQISRNAAAAAAMAGVRLVALRRPEWMREDGDRWIAVADVVGAVAALGGAPRNVFLAVGRQEVAAFEAAPQHVYLVRSVDPVEPRPALPQAQYLLSRGPFALAGERALMAAHRIDVVVAKNSGGEATHAKLVAARQLGIEVVMIGRPAVPAVPEVASVDEALAHVFASAKRGE